MAPPARYYFTTPIYYVSDVPHLGHAYTTVVADALARYHRMRGRPTKYLTGTDEHGQKIERMAADRGVPVRAYAEQVSDVYRAAWKALGIANDWFIRTTDDYHEAVVAELWRRMEAKGDIYLDHYEGHYCVACEQFYTEKELTDGNACPVHKKPIEKVKEESYFFRLSAYEQKLKDFYDGVLKDTGRPFVEPEMRMNEVRAFVDAGLKDFAVSRTTFTWGVPVPGHPGHVVYVWLDALINYYSATRRTPDEAGLAPYWQDGGAIVHLMGKEITRFHAVYWPAFLLSAGLPLPTKIIAHGWWTVDGEKMSKTLGNVVDPLKLANELGQDAFRYFVLREVPLGADGDFSHEALLTRYNAELANDLGNLLNRTLGMVAKYLADGVVPAHHAPGDPQLVATATSVVAAVAAAMEAYAPSKALEEIWRLVREGNTFIDRAAPWKADEAGKRAILWQVLETCRVIAHLVQPFMPDRAVEMLRQLGRGGEALDWPTWGLGHPFTVEKGQPLFPRIDDDRRRALLAKWAPRVAAQPTAPAATQHSPAGAAQQSSAAPQQAPLKPTVTYDDFARLDLRVARVTAAERVPKKDKLLKLTVELGGGEARTIVAGIAATYAPEALVGKEVILLANLAPAKIGGVVSEGMILAAGDAEVLALSALDRPCAPGTKVR